MKKFVRNLVLIGAVASLGACASCPNTTDDYNRTPYGNRTSGSGVAVYGGNCTRSTETMSVREDRVENVRPAEPIFNERVRK